MNVTIAIVLVGVRLISELDEVHFNEEAKGRKKNIPWEIQGATNSLIISDNAPNKHLILKKYFFEVD